MSIGRELLNVPMGDMIRQIATAIADGQAKLDATAMAMAERMGGLQTVRDDKGNVSFNDSRIFFGHEWMTIREARAYLTVEGGLTGTKLDDAVDKLKSQSGLQQDAADGALVRVPTRLSMLELGFSPTFYQFVDTIIEVKIAIKITSETGSSTSTHDSTTETNTASAGKHGGLWGLIAGSENNNRESSSVVTSQVDATYSSKYSYSAEGSSLLRTKLTPVPPPAVLEERIRRMMEEDVQRRQKKLLEQSTART